MARCYQGRIMIRRFAILSACYWTIVAFLLFIDLLGDCGASGRPEVDCPPARAHFELAVLIAVALFLLASIWLAFKPIATSERVGPAAIGFLGALLFLLGYIVTGWWIYPTLP